MEQLQQHFDTTFHEQLEWALAEMKSAPEIVRPTQFWSELNEEHCARIDDAGIENFRRTLARDYFTWMRVLPWDSQIIYLVRNLPISSVIRSIIGTFNPPKHAHIGFAESLALNFLTRLVWEYTERNHPDLHQVSEHAFGNPPQIRKNGMLISQDLANSVLELQSYKHAARGTLCELGGGYGRNAFVAGQLLEFDRYILVDIPPAIVVAQTFLQNVFPNKKHFTLRSFDDFEAVRSEFEASDFVYLLPHQMAVLPDECVDLFINISSLHEMRKEQVNYFMAEIKRLLRHGGNLYLKAWKKSNNKTPEFQIDEQDYDLSGLQTSYWRQCEVQTRFFEAMLEKRAD